MMVIFPIKYPDMVFSPLPSMGAPGYDQMPQSVVKRRSFCSVYKTLETWRKGEERLLKGLTSLRDRWKVSCQREFCLSNFMGGDGWCPWKEGAFIKAFPFSC